MSKEAEPTNEPQGEETKPVPESIGDMSDEQLDELLTGAGEEDSDLYTDVTVGEEEPEEEPEEGSEGEEEAKAEAEDEGEESEGESEEESEEEAEKESEDSEEEDEKDSSDGLEARLEILEAENEKLVAALERERLLRDRNAGKLGALLQKLENRDAKSADGDEFEFEAGDDDSRQTSKKSEVDETLAEIRTEKVNRAIQGAAQEFYSENQVFFETLEKQAGAEVAKKFGADLVAKVHEYQKGMGDELPTMNPKMVAQVSKSMLKSAFADVRIGLLRDLQKRAGEQAEKSRRQVRARKKGAAGIRSKKRPAAQTASKKSKSLSDMSDAELDQALREMEDQFE